MNLKEIKDTARQAFRDQQTQDTEGGVPDAVSFIAGFLAGARHLLSAFDDRVRVIEMQLEDKKKLVEALKFYINSAPDGMDGSFGRKVLKEIGEE